MSVSNSITLAEVPYSAVQGESSWVGIRMMFVRIQGCPVGCSWCDSYYTWPPFAETKVPENIKSTVSPVNMTFEKLAGHIEEQEARHVWWTGGEPTTQCEKIADFIEYFLNSGQFTFPIPAWHICTAGYKWDKRLFQLLDYVTVDVKPPSSQTKSNRAIMTQLSEEDEGNDKVQFKMVVANTEDDKQFAEEQLALYPNTPWTFQPLYVSEPQLFDNKLSVNTHLQNWLSLSEYADWVSELQIKYPVLRLGLQLHKHLYPMKNRGI